MFLYFEGNGASDEFASAKVSETGDPGSTSGENSERDEDDIVSALRLSPSGKDNEFFSAISSEFDSSSELDTLVSSLTEGRLPSFT